MLPFILFWGMNIASSTIRKRLVQNQKMSFSLIVLKCSKSQLSSYENIIQHNSGDNYSGTMNVICSYLT